MRSFPKGKRRIAQDDGGYTSGNMDRPALARLLRAVTEGELDCVGGLQGRPPEPAIARYFTRMLSLDLVKYVKLWQQ